jgi:hypothetical protein
MIQFFIASYVFNSSTRMKLIKSGGYEVKCIKVKSCKIFMRMLNSVQLRKSIRPDFVEDPLREFQGRALQLQSSLFLVAATQIENFV